AAPGHPAHDPDGPAGGDPRAHSGLAVRRDGVGSGAPDAARRARPDGIQHDAGRDPGRQESPRRAAQRGAAGAGAPHHAAGHGRRNRGGAARRAQPPDAHQGSNLVNGDITRVEKPWGYELHWAKTERYVGKLIHVNAGHALSLQYHNLKDETIYLHSGKLLFEIEEGGELKKREMLPGERVHVTPKTVHRMTAIEDSDIFEVSTPELHDVVRLEDRYGREDQKKD